MRPFVVDSVSFAYQGDAPVLQDVCLDLKPSQLTVLLGGNGAGKTTLLRLLSGQLQPTAGRVMLGSLSIATMSPRTIASQIALMPQFEAPANQLSVREIVALGRVPQRGWWGPLRQQDHRVVDEALRATGLDGVQHRSAGTLSGGQRRRIGLARSLAQQASIMLLDEPTSGLDLRHQHEALQQVRGLVGQRAVTAVVSLHDLNLAALYADRVVILNHGRLLADGTPHEVLTVANIRSAFSIDVRIIPHPVHDAPLIIPILQ